MAPSLSQRLSSIRPVLTTDVLPPPVLPLADWAPDRTDLGNPAATVFNGAIATANGARPVKSLSALSNAMAFRARGAFSAKNATGIVSTYTSDVANLYRLSGSTLTDVSGATYATASDDVWEFIKFGTKVLATNFTDPIQGATVGTGNFSDHLTSTLKPKARHMSVVRDFVVLGNTNDGTDGEQRQRVWWSAINDSLDFDPDAATQCDFQDIQDGGAVQKVLGGAEYGLVFMEDAVERMTYNSSGLVFQFDRVDRRRGTPIPQSVIGFGRSVFFISEEGFMVTDGVTTTPIGQNKVDRTFWNQFNLSNKSLMSAAVDPVEKVVMWAFPGTGNTGLPNKRFTFNWADNKWSEQDIDVEWIFRSMAQSATLDGLDVSHGTDIDDAGLFPDSWDSSTYATGEFKLGGIDTAHMYGEFTGTNIAATLETTETNLFPGRLADVTGVRPLIETAGGSVSTTCAVAGRLNQQESVSYDAAAAINTDGFCPVLNSNRFHRFRTSIPADDDWTDCQGVAIHATPAGLF